MHRITYCSVGEACVRGGQAAIMNFLSFFFIFRYTIIVTLSILLFDLFLARHGLHCILHNVHVLWVRAPLSRTIPTDFPLDPRPRFRTKPKSTDLISLSVLSFESFLVSRARALHDAPPSRRAINARVIIGQRSRPRRDGIVSRDFSVSFASSPSWLFRA